MSERYLGIEMYRRCGCGELYIAMHFCAVVINIIVISLCRFLQSLHSIIKVNMWCKYTLYEVPSIPAEGSSTEKAIVWWSYRGHIM